MNSSSSIRRVAVIGGGITGLAAAHRLHELAPRVSVQLFESSDRLGGVLGTERRDGFLWERSADMFTTREPWAIELCQRIGFADQLIPTNESQRQAYVVRRGRLMPVPQGFTLMSPARIWPIVTTPILSPWGKLRLAWEYFTPRQRSLEDESLASFVTRRFGREAFERLVQPLIGGIYTADPERLSMSATMPQFVELERKHGSLIRGMRSAQQKPAERQSSGARYGLFVAARDGMGSFVSHLAARLPADNVRLGAAIQLVSRTEDNRWRLSGTNLDSPLFDGVVIATPAPRAAELLSSIPDLAERLRRIEHAGIAVTVAAFRLDQFARRPHGFGVITPAIERRRAISISFSSTKFAGRAPADHILIRTFVGGACQPELVELSDEELRQITLGELRHFYGLRGEPLWCEVQRWRNTMPQYHVGHLDRIAEIEQQVATLPGLELAGNAYRGVGIPFCIRSGEGAAERLLGSPGSAIPT